VKEEVMGTQTHYWSFANGSMFLAADSGVTGWWPFPAAMHARVAEAWQLWDDVSALTTVQAVDDVNLARDSLTWVDWGVTGYWDTTLTHDWTRLALGTVTGGNIGVHLNRGEHNRYHELWADPALSQNEGGNTFMQGTEAFNTLLHEIGHSLGLDHTELSRFCSIPAQAISSAAAMNSITFWSERAGTTDSTATRETTLSSAARARIPWMAGPTTIC
jgi:Metallo-peptidase family M12B Reprolysin-like